MLSWVVVISSTQIGILTSALLTGCKWTVWEDLALTELTVVLLTSVYKVLPDASSLPIFIAKTPHHHHPSLPLGEVPDCIAKENKFKQCHGNRSLDGTKSICTVCMSWMWFFLETVFLSIFSPSVLSFIPNICFSSHYFFSLMLSRSFSNNVNVHSGVPFSIFSPSHPA